MRGRTASCVSSSNVSVEVLRTSAAPAFESPQYGSRRGSKSAKRPKCYKCPIAHFGNVYGAGGCAAVLSLCFQRSVRAVAEPQSRVAAATWQRAVRPTLPRVRRGAPRWAGHQVAVQGVQRSREASAPCGQRSRGACTRPQAVYRGVARLQHLPQVVQPSSGGGCSAETAAALQRRHRRPTSLIHRKLKYQNLHCVRGRVGSLGCSAAGVRPRFLMVF